MKEQLHNLLTKCIHDLIDQGLLSEMPSKDSARSHQR